MLWVLQLQEVAGPPASWAFPILKPRVERLRLEKVAEHSAHSEFPMIWVVASAELLQLEVEVERSASSHARI